jgi:hypothetical protein
MSILVIAGFIKLAEISCREGFVAPAHASEIGVSQFRRELFPRSFPITSRLPAI